MSKTLHVVFLGSESFYFAGPKGLKLKHQELHNTRRKVTEEELKKRCMAVIDKADEGPTEYRFINDLQELQDALDYEIQLFPVANITIVSDAR